ARVMIECDFEALDQLPAVDYSGLTLEQARESLYRTVLEADAVGAAVHARVRAGAGLGEPPRRLSCWPLAKSRQCRVRDLASRPRRTRRHSRGTAACRPRGSARDDSARSRRGSTVRAAMICHRSRCAPAAG